MTKNAHNSSPITLAEQDNYLAHYIHSGIAFIYSTIFHRCINFASSFTIYSISKVANKLLLYPGSFTWNYVGTHIDPTFSTFTTNGLKNSKYGF
jgi:hypothetical protein